MPEEGRAAKDWCPRADRTGTPCFSLKRTPEFIRLFKSGNRFTGGTVKARHCRNTLGVIRLGFSVSRRTGNAVERNLFRRRLRQLAREEREGRGFDAVVTPLVKLREIGWPALRDDFNKLVTEARR